MIRPILMTVAAVTFYAPQAADAQPTTPPTRPSSAHLLILDAGGTTVSADSTESKTVELAKGGRVLVRPGSTLRHSLLPGTSRSVIEVKGEMAVEVTREQFMLVVVSRAGGAMLLPGSYALRCVGACSALEVTVAKGIATLRADRTDVASIQATTGQWGRAFRDSSSVLVPAESAKHFPLPDSTLRKAP